MFCFVFVFPRRGKIWERERRKGKEEWGRNQGAIRASVLSMSFWIYLLAAWRAFESIWELVASSSEKTQSTLLQRTPLARYLTSGFTWERTDSSPQETSQLLRELSEAAASCFSALTTLPTPSAYKSVLEKDISAETLPPSRAPPKQRNGARCLC